MKFAGKWPDKFSGKFSGRVGSGGRTGALPYVTTSSDYDGTNDFAPLAAGLTGAVDGKQGTFSGWVRLDGGDGADQHIIFGTADAVRIQRSAANRFAIRCENAAGGVILSLLTVANTYTAGATWRHVLMSWDLATVGARHLYINDTSDLNAATFTDDTIDYTLSGWTVGATPAGAAKLDGCLSELFFHTTYVDLSVTANRRRFINAHGKPVSLGQNGSRPLGVQPLIYAPNGDPSANLGSGGTFTITGALTAGSTSPSD